MSMFCVIFIRPLQLLLNLEECDFTGSVMLRKVIFQKSIVEVNTLYLGFLNAQFNTKCAVLKKFVEF